MAISNLNQLIKKLAIEAVRASKPCDIVMGTVADAAPLKIKISSKVTLDSDFFVLTKTAEEREMKKGDEIVLLRANGGQRYLVLDKVV